MVRRSTIYLVIVFFILLLGFYLLQNRTDEEAEATPTLIPAPEMIIGIDLSQLERISIVEGSGGKVSFMMSDKGWMVVEPEEAEADDSRITNGVSGLLGLQALREFDADSDLGVIGLTPPAYEITFTTAEGDTTLLIGDESPTGSGYYALVNGGAPVLISKFPIDNAVGWIAAPPFAPTPTPSTDG